MDRITLAVIITVINALMLLVLLILSMNNNKQRIDWSITVEAWHQPNITEPMSFYPFDIEIVSPEKTIRFSPIESENLELNKQPQTAHTNNDKITDIREPGAGC